MYEQMTDTNKQKLIQKLYTEQKMSFADIAKKYDTYPNKVRRDAIKFNIEIRNKSDAQKNVLHSGKASHPTKGKIRTEDEKNKIALGVYNAWGNISDDERKKRQLDSKKRWDEMDSDIKDNMLSAAHAAIRKTSVEGSKLEKFLLNSLIQHGFKPEFHKEQILANTRLQIDIFLPKENIAIEVDGPSHFTPVWGDDTLKKNQKYDEKKTGLILGKGIKLIRIKQTSDYSTARANICAEKLINLLGQIKNSPEKLFYIKDENE
jgi:very-short-patch-repair endonuclease